MGRRLLTPEERGALVRQIRLELGPKLGRVVSRRVLVEEIAKQAGYSPPKDQSAVGGWESGSEMGLIDGLALAELAGKNPAELIWTDRPAPAALPVVDDVAPPNVPRRRRDSAG